MTDNITPGDWITDGGCHIQALYAPTDGGKPFWHTIARTDQPLVSGEQAGANARVMASANKLLDVLEEYLKDKGGLLLLPDNYEAWYKKAVSVVANARGGP